MTIRLRHYRDGFTLLEVLLAALLAVTLMVGLWNLFHVYTRLFETGQARTAQSQLVRALLQQLTEDLQSAIQDPVPGGSVPSRREGDRVQPAKRFGLFGSQDALYFDVLHPSPLSWTVGSDEDPSSVSEAGPSVQLPDFRTVYYEFIAPASTEVEEAGGNMGLIRRELDFGVPDAQPGDEAARRGRSMNAALDSDLDADELAIDDSGDDSGDDSTIVVPEVEAAEFRYFDGGTWSNEWNSLQREGLPAAVEVVLRIRDGGVATRSPSPTGTIETAETAGVGPLSAEERHDDTSLSVVRLVIDLPRSPWHSAPRASESATFSPVRQAMRRSTSPRRSTVSRPVEPAGAFLSDQWMRSVP